MSLPAGKNRVNNIMPVMIFALYNTHQILITAALLKCDL